MLLTYSTGSHQSFTILKAVNEALSNLPSVRASIAQPRKSNDSINKDYFHYLNKESDLYDAVLRYSYLAKNETKEMFKGSRVAISKFPRADKTKQEQISRKIKEESINE